MYLLVQLKYGLNTNFLIVKNIFEQMFKFYLGTIILYPSESEH